MYIRALLLEGTKGTLGKGTVQKIGMRYVSTRFNMTIQALPGANRPLPNGPLVPSDTISIAVIVVIVSYRFCRY